MADARILKPFILSWEGGYANHPADKGGPTNKGVTLSTFRQYFGKDKTVEDLKRITSEQWLHIFRKGFWDRCSADRIRSQSVANLIVDWTYHSGPRVSIPRVQKILGVKADGVIGEKTLAAMNSADSLRLFTAVWNARKEHFEKLPNFSVFGKGWLNRINGIGFGSLSYSGRTVRFHDER